MQTILVCDDDKQIVEAIDIYLTGEGFEVIKAYDGYEVLEYLESHDADLLIIDVMMPGLDGIRTTLKVRENSSIPIIILSAKSEDTDKILGLNNLFIIITNQNRCLLYTSADADVVDVLAHNPFFAVQPFQVHLQTGISLGNAADRAVQLIHLQRLGKHEMENQQVEEREKHRNSVKNHLLLDCLLFDQEHAEHAPDHHAVQK